MAKTFDPRNTWFTADTHFNDKSLLHRGFRPFGSVEEMNRELIRRWNETVPENGVVFHLGDFSQGGYRELRNILPKLHGKIYLIQGNHDNLDLRNMGGFKKKFVQSVPQKTIRIEENDIILHHYPFLFYKGELDNVWQLFGHVHSGPYETSGFDLPRLKMLFPFQYDVGVDNNDYRPVSYLEVKAIITAQARAVRIRSERYDNGESLSSLTEHIPETVTKKDLREAADAYLAADQDLVEHYGMETLRKKETAGDRLYRLTCALLQHGLKTYRNAYVEHAFSEDADAVPPRPEDFD